MSKQTNMWRWRSLLCKYLRWGSRKSSFRRALGGAIKTFHTKKSSLRSLHPAPHLHISNVFDPEHQPTPLPTPPPCPSPRLPIPSPLVSCQSPNLKGTHFTEGDAEVRGRRLTAALWAEANFDDEPFWRSAGRGGQREPGGVAGSSSL